MKDQYEFTTDWFVPHMILWTPLLERFKPAKILEIGSFEGMSTSFIIQECSQWNPLHVHCIDTWRGGEEHVGVNFDEVERRFDSNVNLAMRGRKNDISVYKHKGYSFMGLAELMLEKQFDFDMVYIDGSHIASDVLLDATMSFQLLKVGGLLIFDDYLRTDQKELQHPQIAVDAFMSIYREKLHKVGFTVDTPEKHLDDLEAATPKGLYQKYLQKIAL